MELAAPIIICGRVTFVVQLLLTSYCCCRVTFVIKNIIAEDVREVADDTARHGVRWELRDELGMRCITSSMHWNDQ